MLTLALPTGDLRGPVAAALAAGGLACSPYADGSRSLRLSLEGRDDVALRVFREKDIPIQVALGNYDFGICSAAWVEELQSRFPYDDVTVLRPLGFGRHQLVAAAAPETLQRLGPLRSWSGVRGLRIVSEFPGIAERFARRMRFARYSIHSVWGAAEAYPPEDADLAILAVKDPSDVLAHGLEPLVTLLDASAWLIAGRRGLAGRDLGAVIGRLLAMAAPAVPPGTLALPRASQLESRLAPAAGREREGVRLAVPDGHAQRHTFAALAAAGLTFDGYGEKSYVRRPASGIDGLEVKVIRPQDMPQQVALGNFDLAITGRDWLLDHLFAFPASPVAEALDLQRSRYGIAAAVSEDVPATTLAEALGWWRGQGHTAIRVASEYPNIADHFARLRHLGRYQVIPVNGASEAFVPEDSEILIEGTETGSSFRANRLKKVDHVFDSTNCVITRTSGIDGPRRRLVEQLVTRFRDGLDG